MQRINGIDAEDADRYFLLYETFTSFLSQVAREMDPPSFECHTSPFSLFGYLCHSSGLPENIRFAGFRILRTHANPGSMSFGVRFTALHWLIIELAGHLSDKPLPGDLFENLVFPPDEFWTDSIPKTRLADSQVVLVAKKANTDLTYEGYWVDFDGREVVIRPDKIMRIKNQILALREADEHLYFPRTVRLLDIDAQHGVLIPGAMVFLPDYLIDITAVSQCFTPYGESPSGYLLRKIQPYSSSHHLLIGNCVNQILDELIFAPDLTWDEVLPKLFRINELTWATYTDQDTRSHIGQIRSHFHNLKKTIHHEFLESGFQQQYCAVEPSFYSPMYGLQGRLDLLYDHPDNAHPRMIIELKSGKIFNPNSYGLNHPHYIQTLLYDLLIRSAYPDATDPVNFILYSAEENNNLRHAPAIRDWQYESLGVRNQLVILDCRLARWTKTQSTIYEILKEKNENLVGYTGTERDSFYRYYEASSGVVKSYFDAFQTFLVREQMSAKLGRFGSEGKGQSQLWASAPIEKNQHYRLLDGLEVKADCSQEQNPIVVFRKTQLTNPLANFRTGDVILTYPASRRNRPVEGQLFRCSLVSNTVDEVTVRLRARQYKPIFTEDSVWCIEHDHLDSSFRQMNQSLIRLLHMSSTQSQMFLGMKPPRPGDMTGSPSKQNGMTPTQVAALDGMKSTRDYYLLWGPPGTGKTSVLLRNLVAEKLTDVGMRILLVGYTNRAVDEICAAILGIEGLQSEEILRIGSRYGTDEAYRPLLLHERTQALSSRAQLLSMLGETRVVCGTIASLSGQYELFDLIQFDFIVIDEASQILEPALIGLLSMGIPYVLIGDHKQLPAVVSQPREDTFTDEMVLHDIGLYDLSNSYFERIFKIAKDSGWGWAYGILIHQGRMHQDLMSYPNQFFYENILEILPFEGGNQTQSLMIEFQGDDKLARTLSRHRSIFIPTVSQNYLNNKINPEEADRIVEILQKLKLLNPELPLDEIGVITPYRAQIATIRHAMAAAGIGDMITVDTVERYQGGAKDVIIISYCINTLSQIQLLKESMTEDGVDRKLNVAMTRARKQIIFLANEELLLEHPLYEALLYHFIKYKP